MAHQRQVISVLRVYLWVPLKTTLLTQMEDSDYVSLWWLPVNFHASPRETTVVLILSLLIQQLKLCLKISLHGKIMNVVFLLKNLEILLLETWKLLIVNSLVSNLIGLTTQVGEQLLKISLLLENHKEIRQMKWDFIRVVKVLLLREQMVFWLRILDFITLIKVWFYYSHAHNVIIF